MKKFILLAVFGLFCVLPFTGCFTFDKAHNREIVQVWRDDMGYIHEDLDWLFGLRRRSYLHAWVD